jgi:hypothetical protein
LGRLSSYKNIIYTIVFTTIIGVIGWIFVTFYNNSISTKEDILTLSSKVNVIEERTKYLATKEDIGKLDVRMQKMEELLKEIKNKE